MQTASVSQPLFYFLFYRTISFSLLTRFAAGSVSEKAGYHTHLSLCDNLNFKLFWVGGWGDGEGKEGVVRSFSPRWTIGSIYECGPAEREPHFAVSLAYDTFPTQRSLPPSIQLTPKCNSQ